LNHSFIIAASSRLVRGNGATPWKPGIEIDLGVLTAVWLVGKLGVAILVRPLAMAAMSALIAAAQSAKPIAAKQAPTRATGSHETRRTAGSRRLSAAPT
jgi:hypothetical protein